MRKLRPLAFGLLAGLALGCVASTADYPPLPELCNLEDDDGDDRIDEGSTCPEFETNAGTGRGACHEGVGRCVIVQCASGRVDLDGGRLGDPAGYANGCEASCTPSADGFDICVGGEPDCADNCDNADDDCDGVVDEARERPVSMARGVCSGIPFVCTGRWHEPDYAAVAETYEDSERSVDGLDNDCDGVVDEVERCNMTDDDGDVSIDEGACPGATARCNEERCMLDCALGRRDVDGDYSTGCECAVLGEADANCDRVDDDCDGRLDEDYVGPVIRELDGVCRGVRLICTDRGTEPPDLSALPDYEASEARCDDLDNDCDGVVDEDIDLLGLGCAVGEGPCRRDGVYRCNPGGPYLPPTCVATSEEDCNAPVIESFDANLREVSQAEQVRLTARVVDPDGDLVGGELLYEGQPVAEFGNERDAAYALSLGWNDVNEIDPFAFGPAGESRRFTARFFDARGNDTTASVDVRFVCEVGGRTVPACTGECAPAPDVGCACFDVEPDQSHVCAGNNRFSCGINAVVGDCGDVLGSGASGTCVEGVGSTGAECVMPVGEGCWVLRPEGLVLLPCGEGRIDLTLGCVDGVCTPGFAPCEPGDFAVPGDFEAYCQGDTLVTFCADWVGDGRAGQAAVAMDCNTLDPEGGVEGCFDNGSVNACQQTMGGGFCVPGRVECRTGPCGQVDPETRRGICPP